MKIFKIALIFIILGIVGCASTPSTSTLRISGEVRAASQTDKRLFSDIVMAPGGVGFVDKALYPRAKASEVIKIEVITPYTGEAKGVERWHIQHDGNDIATYLVNLESTARFRLPTAGWMRPCART
ncbi:hypothetical protein LL254_13850 [Marinobacter nauticus]|uniref:hypothetical protein n=1 Tax=Marinobacter nauticus TaxID=2743 RepID=UPI001D182B8B|nr:hypothetical protein [Marinobacter nauticus]MCC4271798.1 hypothetical protein [Marinobacter nauticus]